VGVHVEGPGECVEICEEDAFKVLSGGLLWDGLYDEGYCHGVIQNTIKKECMSFI
jgi:hypothetical protein